MSADGSESLSASENRSATLEHLRAVHRGRLRPGPCDQHRLLQGGDGELSIRLAERDQSHPRGHQIRQITLQAGSQGREQTECPASPR
jgi:hypothetical protein